MESLLEVCRLCLKKENLQSIFHSRFGTKDMRNVLYITTGVEIHSKDTVSQKVCGTCLQLVVEIYKFRKKAQKVDILLKAKRLQLLRSAFDVPHDDEIILNDDSDTDSIDDIIFIGADQSEHGKHLLAPDDEEKESGTLRPPSSDQNEEPERSSVDDNPHLRVPIVSLSRNEVVSYFTEKDIDFTEHVQTVLSSPSEAETRKRKCEESNVMHVRSVPLYVCNVCSSVYSSLKVLWRHKSQHLVCQFCKTRCRSMEIKQEHLEKHCATRQTLIQSVEVCLEKVELNPDIRAKYPNAFLKFEDENDDEISQEVENNPSTNDEIMSTNETQTTQSTNEATIPDCSTVQVLKKTNQSTDDEIISDPTSSNETRTQSTNEEIIPTSSTEPIETQEVAKKTTQSINSDPAPTSSKVPSKTQKTVRHTEESTNDPIISDPAPAASKETTQEAVKKRKQSTNDELNSNPAPNKTLKMVRKTKLSTNDPIISDPAPRASKETTQEAVKKRKQSTNDELNSDPAPNKTLKMVRKTKLPTDDQLISDPAPTVSKETLEVTQSNSDEVISIEVKPAKKKKKSTECKKAKLAHTEFETVAELKPELSIENAAWQPLMDIKLPEDDLLKSLLRVHRSITSERSVQTTLHLSKPTVVNKDDTLARCENLYGLLHVYKIPVIVQNAEKFCASYTLDEGVRARKEMALWTDMPRVDVTVPVKEETEDNHVVYEVPEVKTPSRNVTTNTNSPIYVVPGNNAVHAVSLHKVQSGPRIINPLVQQPALPVTVDRSVQSSTPVAQPSTSGLQSQLPGPNPPSTASKAPKIRCTVKPARNPRTAKKTPAPPEKQKPKPKTYGRSPKIPKAPAEGSKFPRNVSETVTWTPPGDPESAPSLIKLQPESNTWVPPSATTSGNIVTMSKSSGNVRVFEIIPRNSKSPGNVPSQSAQPTNVPSIVISRNNSSMLPANIQLQNAAAAASNPPKLPGNVQLLNAAPANPRRESNYQPTAFNSPANIQLLNAATARSSLPGNVQLQTMSMARHESTYPPARNVQLQHAVPTSSTVTTPKREGDYSTSVSRNISSVQRPVDSAGPSTANWEPTVNVNGTQVGTIRIRSFFDLT